MTSILRAILVDEIAQAIEDLDKINKDLSWEARNCEPSRRQEIARKRAASSASRARLLKWRRAIQAGDSNAAWTARFEMALTWK